MTGFVTGFKVLPLPSRSVHCGEGKKGDYLGLGPGLSLVRVFEKRSVLGRKGI